VPLKGLVDVDSELAKLGRDRAKAEASLKQVNGKLGNGKFLANAPEAVVAKEQGKKEELEARLARIEEAEQRLHKIGS
jgi:valyl-tRNA synthetase